MAPREPLPLQTNGLNFVSPVPQSVNDCIESEISSHQNECTDFEGTAQISQVRHNGVIGGAAALVEAFNTHSEGREGQARDHGHQRETLSAPTAANQGDAAEAESAIADIPSLASEIASSDSGLGAAMVVR